MPVGVVSDQAFGRNGNFGGGNEGNGNNVQYNRPGISGLTLRAGETDER